MYIDKFLKDNPQIKLPNKIIQICRTGEELMSQSPDPVHDHHHIGRLLEYLHRFLKQHPGKIDFAVLLPAICWHDVWKAKRKSLNSIKLLYYQLYEGLGSMWIFYEKNSHHLSPSDLGKIGYAIRKHSQFQFFSLKTTEAKILRDIDDLDILSAKRLRPLLKKRSLVHPLAKKLGKLYLYFQTKPSSGQASQYRWTSQKLQKQNQIAKKLLRWL